ncbi:MAG: hypothetical protein E7029_07225 [Planctomycetaceae bacterium]|nr:hypothetical protein [Planctomycetaceae bacterium]
MTKIAQNRSQLVLSFSRKQRSIELPGLAALRQALQVNPESTMIRVLTGEAMAKERVLATWLLMTEDLCGEFRESCLQILLKMQPVEQVLEMFLWLKRNRINRSFVKKTVLRYLWTLRWIEELVTRKPAVIRDILEHVIGRNTARGAAAALSRDPSNAAAVRKFTCGFMANWQRAAVCILELYHYRKNMVLQKGQHRFQYLNCHQEFYAAFVSSAPVQKTVKVTTRGDISAALVQLYRGAKGQMYEEAVEKAVQKLAVRIPCSDQRVAMVLDISGSTKGTGEREWGCVSQSTAFRLLMEKVCRLSVFQVGGMDADGRSSFPPIPSGETDLASALIAALESRPDQVVIVSDGFENFQEGDLEWVLKSLPEEIAAIPVTFIHSMFTSKDSLEKRRPAKELPELYFWHELDFVNVCAALFGNASTVENESERQEKRDHLRGLIRMAQEIRA